MSERNLLQRLLDERPPDQAEQTWRRLRARLVSPRPRRWVAVSAVVTLALTAVLVWNLRRQPPREAMYLFISRSAAPSSEALELTIQESP